MNHRSCRWLLRNKTEMMLIRKGYYVKDGYMSNGKFGSMWCKTYEDYKHCTEISDLEEEDEQCVIHAFMELGKET